MIDSVILTLFYKLWIYNKTTLHRENSDVDYFTKIK